MYSVNLYSKSPASKTDLFNFKGGMSNVVKDGSYEKTKDLFDSIVDLRINRIEKNEGFQTSEGIENIELGYDVAKVGYSGVKVAEAAYAVGVGTGGLAFLGLLGALALAGGVAVIGVGIAIFAKEIDDFYSQKNGYAITNPFDFQPTHLSGNDKESDKSIFQPERDDFFKDFQDRLMDLSRDLVRDSSSGSSDRSGNHENNSQDDSNNSEDSINNDNKLGKMSKTPINSKVNLLGR